MKIKSREHVNFTMFFPLPDLSQLLLNLMWKKKRQAFLIRYQLKFYSVNNRSKHTLLDICPGILTETSQDAFPHLHFQLDV